MKIIQSISAGLAVVLLVACSSPAQTLTPTLEVAITPAQAATATTLLPTPTQSALYQQVSLGAITTNESGKAPVYTFKTQVPVMAGSSDPRVAKFNQGVSAIVKAAVDQFHKDLSEQSAVPLAGGSYFDLRYKLVSPPGPIFSLQLVIEGMTDGAAHPYHVTISYNFNLETGREIALNDLFLPAASPLPVIADYSKKELAKRDIGFEMFAAGADPKPENYTVWNISADGLVIFFNEYQVAPYVAGPQTVVIPFAELQKIIDPSGPLAGLKP
jgi:hypothetical protein